MSDVLDSPDRWLPVLLGGALLLMGRRLFWLLIATLGFLFAFTLVQRLAPEMTEPLRVLVAIVAGLLGALLAIFAQKLAVGAAGMLFGAYSTLWLIEHYGADLGNWEWVALVAGGVLAGVLALLVFDTALVVVSSIIGASLLVGVARLGGLPSAILFAALLIVGITVQLGSGAKKRKPRRPRRARAAASAE